MRARLRVLRRALLDRFVVRVAEGRHLVLVLPLFDVLFFLRFTAAQVSGDFFILRCLRRVRGDRREIDRDPERNIFKRPVALIGWIVVMVSILLFTMSAIINREFLD